MSEIEWKDCTSCQKWCKSNFTCAVYGWGTLQEEVYIGCGYYAKN